MQSIQNQHSALVAWLDEDNLFSTDLYWVAFIQQGHCYSSSTLKWLGPFQQQVFWCADGKPVAVVEGAAPAAVQLKPEQPPSLVKRPMFPLKPKEVPPHWKAVRPAWPAEAWSALSFEQWLAQ